MMPIDSAGVETDEKPAGRRERKREETRQRLIRTAHALFTEKGFDATTVDEIAAAAGVSRRTFFHYFASKDDVILSRQVEFERALFDGISNAPAGEPLLDIAERALVGALGHFDWEEAAVIHRLKCDSPTLRAGDQGKYERLEGEMTARLLARGGATADPLAARLVAMVVIGTLRVAAGGWQPEAPGHEPLDRLARRVFGTLRAALLESRAE